MENAFIEPLLTKGLSEDDKNEDNHNPRASRAHYLVFKAKLIQQTFIKNLLGSTSFC